MPEPPIHTRKILNIPKTIQEAVASHRQGNLREAERLYQAVLEAQPDSFDALHFLGILRAQQGNSEAAVKLISLALARNPRSADAHSNLGNAFQQLGHYKEAIASYDEALAIRPDFSEALYNRGNTLQALKRHDEAIASYDQALAIKPDHAHALNNRGNVFQELGRYDEAIASYDQALAIEPDDAEALNNRGSAMYKLNRYDEALASYDKALAIKPGHAQAHYNRGNVLQDLGRHDEAIACYDKALAIKPDYPEALNNRGNALSGLYRFQEAIASYGTALEIKPDDVDALTNMGTAFADQGRRDEAQDCCRQALALKPDHAEARWLHVMAIIPRVYRPQENPAACREEFSRELAELDAWFDARRMNDHEVVGRSQPFWLAYQEENNRDLLSRYGTLCARIMKHWHDQQTISSAVAGPAGVVRVGIISAHVRDHSVWNAIVKGWLQHFDRKRFELHVFHLGSQQDSETAWARFHSTSFEQGVKGLRRWVVAIEGKHPDVLIYPEVGMDPMTVRLASLRLAPVQIAAWGHPETTGLPTMDYYVSAEAFEPPRAREHYTEELVALPRLGCCYTPSPAIAGNPDLAGLGIDSEAPILLCPGSPFKYAPQYDSVLIGIARKLGRCQFVFFVYERRELSDTLCERLVANFARSGLDFRDHGVFIPWQARASFHGLMRRADVFLDTIGFSGFTTAMQAVECGLPIVTREGRFMRGRLASGILRTLGIPELIAGGEDDYIELAVRLSLDAQYRRHIRQRIENSRDVLFGDTAAVRALEDFLTYAVKRN
jgi:protein O-GlcNAc transferase